MSVTNDGSATDHDYPAEDRLLRPAQTLPRAGGDHTGPDVRAVIELKPSNPKDLIGSGKIPFHLWPETATVMGAMALLDGALKYGRSNWRAVGIRLTIYTDALRRHTNKLVEGEWIDPDSKLPHVAHILACGAIIADAHAGGKLVNDAMYPGGYTKLVEEMTPHVARLKDLHKDKNPKHFTIADGGTA